MLRVYIDGVTKDDIGGWGVYIIDSNEKTYALKGTAEGSTNRLEIIACLEGLKFTIEKFPQHAIYINTKSKYLKDSATVWARNWAKNGWRTINGLAVKNKDLWQEYLKLKAGKEIIWGFLSTGENEMATKLASQAIEEAIV